MTTRSSVFLNFELYGEPDGLMAMDYFFWLVRDSTRTVLVDCGFRPDVGRRRGRDVLADLATGLAAVDVEPADIDQIVITHAHYDHIGNLSLLPNAEALIARREFAFWTGTYGRRAQFSAIVEREEIGELAERARDGRLRFVEESLTIAPGLSVEVVGGHTPGQLIVNVALAPAPDSVAGRLDRPPAQRAILAADAAHYDEELERDRPFSLVADVTGMYRAFDRLRDLADEPGTSTVVVPGHDPSVRRRFPPAGTHRKHGPQAFRIV